MKDIEDEPFPDHLMPSAVNLARHEMGHWVIARRLGFVPCSVTALIHLNGGRDGGSEIILSENINSIEEIILYLERRIQVCWAGVVAEALGGGNTAVKVDPAYARSLLKEAGGRTDAKVARELLHCLRNLRGASLQGDCATQFGAIFSDLWGKTIDIVEQHSEIILALASNLSERIRGAGVSQKAVFQAHEIEELEFIKEWVEKNGLMSTAAILARSRIQEVPDE